MFKAMPAREAMQDNRRHMFSKHIEATMVYSGLHSPSADDPQAGGDLGQLSRRLAKPPTVEVAAQGNRLSFEEVRLISRQWRLWCHGFCKGGAPQSCCLNIKRRATCHLGQLGHERCSHISEWTGPMRILLGVLVDWWC